MVRLLLLLALALPVCGRDFLLRAGETNRPLLLAFYHPWYGTPSGPSHQWRKWDSFRFPDRYQPDRITNGWRHDIASADYPLIGPYDVSDPEVVRWHFRLAKAAGIDGFLCSWWKLGQPDALWDWQYQLFDKVFLRVAAEEQFSIGVIDECAHYIHSYDQLVSRATNYLPLYARSPGYLRINGKPAWYIYQVWDDWLKPEAAARYVHQTEAAAGNVFWIFDKLRAQAISVAPGAHLVAGQDWLALTNIDCFGSYSLYANWRETNAAALAQLYSGFVRHVHAAGHLAQLPILPGHDNTAVNESPYIVPRNGNATLRAFLAAVDAARPDIAVVCSFNELFEMPAIAPAINWDDPYRYLKTIASWRGKSFVAPPLPPETSIDPLILPKLKRSTAQREHPDR